MDDPIVLVMTVEVRPGVNGLINVKRNDDPTRLANEYARHHGLNADLTRSLAKLITINKQQAMDKLQDREWMRWQRNVSAQKSVNEPTEIRPSTQSYVSAPSPQLPSNPGERLYLKGQVFKNIKSKRLEESLKEQEYEQQQQYTFSPNISKLNQSKRYGRIEDHLMKEGKNLSNKKEILRAKALEKSLSECTFVPTLNERSQKLDATRESHRPRFEELYEEAVFRKERQEMLTEACYKSLYSFTPNTQLTERQNRETSPEAVSNRLYNDGMERKIKREQEIEQYQKKVLSETKFRPAIGRSPTNRNNSGVPIGDYLYSKRHQNSHTAVPQAQPEKRSRPVSQNSEKLYQSYRLNNYKILFNLLDNDADGMISANKINIDAIDIQTLEVLLPLLESLEERGNVLNFQEFVTQMEQLFENLTVGQRAMLFKKQNVNDNVTYTFQPQVDQNSVTMASKSRSPGDIYYRQFAQKQTLDLKLKEGRYHKALSEMDGCTFKPRTTPYSRPIQF